VQQAIDAARTDRTAILAAHRLSTLRDANRILVFDGGQVVETGTDAELIRHGGVFAELARYSAPASGGNVPGFDVGAVEPARL
jgi:ATP-binding cassette subfamily B protein